LHKGSAREAKTISYRESSREAPSKSKERYKVTNG